MKVLIVDDEQRIVSGVRKYFEQAGFDVLAVPGVPEQALFADGFESGETDRGVTHIRRITLCIQELPVLKERVS